MPDEMKAIDHSPLQSDDFPWRLLFSYAVCDLRIQPQEFWCMSFREMGDLVDERARSSNRSTPPGPRDLAALLDIFPDHG